MRKRGVILLYHRIGSYHPDPHHLAVAQHRFEQQLDVLREYRVVPLADWKDSGARVAVTFDDGYEDNVVVGQKLLRQAELPATFFVTAGRVGQQEEFWWDRLASLLLAVGRQAQHLDLNVGGRRLWADVRSPAARERAHWALYWRLRPLPPQEIGEAIDAVQRQLGVGYEHRRSHRMMSHEQLRAAAADPLVEIGAHTMRHPYLATQSPDVQRDEIEGGKRTLERSIGATITSFAYPFGNREAFDDTTVRLVAEAGYARACTTMGHRSRRRASGRLRLPRRVVGDWAGEDFRRRLDQWLSDSGDGS